MPNKSYAINTVPALNQKSERMVKWDTSAKSYTVVGSHRKMTKERNNVDMTRGRHNRKSFLK